MISCPDVTIDNRVEILEKILNTKLDALTKNFIKLILLKRKTSLITSIAAKYHKLVIDKMHKMDITAVATSPLQEEQQAQLRRKLEQKFNKKVQLEHDKDPSLLAGVVLFIGNQLLDLSIKGKLVQLKKQLLKAEL